MSVDPALVEIYGADGSGMLDRARKEWERRKEAVEAAKPLPAYPYRIRGDTEKNTWWVEEAEHETTSVPHDDMWSYRYAPFIYFGREEIPAEYLAMRELQDKKLAAKINAHKPKTKIVWSKIGDEDEDGRVEGFVTYAKALAWLREYLEPVRDESVYFDATGHEKPCP